MSQLIVLHQIRFRVSVIAYSVTSDGVSCKCHSYSVTSDRVSCECHSL